MACGQLLRLLGLVRTMEQPDTSEAWCELGQFFQRRLDVFKVHQGVQIEVAPFV